VFVLNLKLRSKMKRCRVKGTRIDQKDTVSKGCNKVDGRFQGKGNVGVSLFTLFVLFQVT